MYLELHANKAWSFWLDSSRVEPGLSRFSFLGDATGPLAEVLTYRIGQDSVRVQASSGATYYEPGTIFDVLEQRLAACQINSDELPFDFNCGYVGYFGYELKQYCGSPNRHQAVTPDALWLRVDRMVVLDHLEDRTYLIALSRSNSKAQLEAKTWLRQTAALLAALPQERIDQGAMKGCYVDSEQLLARNKTRYLSDIEECRRQLMAGESYEICLTNMLHASAPENVLAFYRRLRQKNPAPYAALLRLSELKILSSSPECFLNVDRNRNVRSKPIKGTAARSADPIVDNDFRRSLTTDPKTRAENLMIVDLVRNDLGQVCEVGSIAVLKFLVVESYSTVHQLVSTICGRLSSSVSVIDCIRACFPGGSMTGAPKLRAIEITDQLESEARGVYSGVLGFLGLNGTAELSMVIRTAVCWGEQMFIGAGGAIVLDSEAETEYVEMLLKGETTLLGYC